MILLNNYSIYRLKKKGFLSTTGQNNLSKTYPSNFNLLWQLSN